MCKFFSCRSDGAGNVYYLDAEQRKVEIDKGNNPDSHTFIAEYFGFKGKDEDLLNAYEYNPLTKEFKIDRLLNKDDSNKVKELCISLDFKTIVPELIIKPIIHPFRDFNCSIVSDVDIENLKKWESVRDSVWDSVRDSVWESVWDSMGAYLSSFFNIPKWEYIEHEKAINPFQCCIDLWENGLVPSFDGKVWRLHAGANADVVYEWVKEVEDAE